MENDNTFENLQAEYVKKLAEYKEQKAKLAEKIERLERKQKKNKNPNWPDHFIRPIMEELVCHMPEIEWERRSEFPVFGLRAECPIFGKTSDGRTVGITFTCDSSTGTLYYDTGEKRNNHSSGTIGDINGFNNLTKPVENISVLVEHVRRQTNL